VVWSPHHLGRSVIPCSNPDQDRVGTLLRRDQCLRSQGAVSESISQPDRRRTATTRRLMICAMARSDRQRRSGYGDYNHAEHRAIHDSGGFQPRPQRRDGVTPRRNRELVSGIVHDGYRNRTDPFVLTQPSTGGCADRPLHVLLAYPPRRCDTPRNTQTSGDPL
jgi:hypothetical protein